MTPAAFAAAAINARLSADVRRRMADFAGASVSANFFGLRMCFRIGEDGRWRAASPFIETDAEMQTDGEGVSVRGDGALLKILNEVREQCAPQTIAAEFFGTEQAAQMQKFAEDMFGQLRELPAQCGFAAGAEEVADFNKRAAAFDAKVAAVAKRISRLEANA